jgi:hypothetical protein
VFVMFGGHLVSGLMKNDFEADPANVSEIMTIPEILPLVFVMFGGHLVSGLIENVLEAEPAVGEFMAIPEILPRVCQVWRPSCLWFDGECSGS